MELRPTVAADLPHVVGEPLPYRIKATTVLVDDVVVGVGGIGFLPDNTVVAFVQMVDGAARKYPVALHRAGLATMAEIARSSLKCVLAEARTDNAAAERWLLRLGFKPLLTRSGAAVIINGKKTYVWKRADVE